MSTDGLTPYARATAAAFSMNVPSREISLMLSAIEEMRVQEQAVADLTAAVSDLLDVMDRYPENPVPMNRNSATVNQLRDALARAGVK